MSRIYSCFMSIFYFRFAQSKGYPPDWNCNLQKEECRDHRDMAPRDLPPGEARTADWRLVGSSLIAFPQWR